MGYGSSDELKYFLNIIYMDSICDELKEDMHKIEEDSKKNWLLRDTRFNRSLYSMFYRFY